MTDITPIIQGVLTLLAAIITVIIAPYLKKKLGDEKFNEGMRWVRVAVKAAEQLYVGSGRGDEKNAYVKDFLNSKGLTYDTSTVNTMIESVVLELNQTELPSQE